MFEIVRISGGAVVYRATNGVPMTTRASSRYQVTILSILGTWQCQILF